MPASSTAHPSLALLKPMGGFCSSGLELGSTLWHAAGCATAPPVPPVSSGAAPPALAPAPAALAPAPATAPPCPPPALPVPPALIAPPLAAPPLVAPPPPAAPGVAPGWLPHAAKQAANGSTHRVQRRSRRSSTTFSRPKPPPADNIRPGAGPARAGDHEPSATTTLRRPRPFG